MKLFKKIFLTNITVSMVFALSLFGVEPVRIMPLGDSLTYGADGSSGAVDASIAYRGSLWTGLSNTGYNVDFVGTVQAGSNYQATDPSFDLDNEGHWGWRADQIASNITTYLNTNPADIVLLHIGTNDLDQGQDISSTVTDVETILDNIKSFNSNIEVIIAHIINQQTYDQQTSDYNDALQAMIQNRIANGDPIVMVDMENGADINYTSDMADKFHPNQSGFAKMANLWSTALQSVIPTHQWKLDETSGSNFADAYRDANGTCVGAGCPMAIGGAQSFDGTNQIDVTNVSGFNFPVDSNFTIEFWMKTDTPTVNVNGTTQNNVMIGRGDGSKLSWFVGVNGTAPIRFGLFDSNDGVVTGTQILDGNVSVVDSTWHHIACVRDSSANKNRIYVDGVLSGEKTVAYDAGFDEGTTAVNIGWLNWTNNGQKFYYDGSLDEVTIFNGALNEAQIKRHYQAGRQVGAALSITTTPITSVELNTPYYYDANSSKDPLAVFDWLNGASPASWMSINTDGEITGTPDTVANVDVNITATESTETATQNYVLKVRNTANLPADMGYYWKLDEAGSPYFDSYSGADGECSGTGCPTQVAGQVGSAQSFNGTNQIDVTDVSGFNFPVDSNFTIEFWMNTGASTVNVNGATQNNVMIGRGDGSKLSWFIGVNGTAPIRFGLFDSNDGVTGTQILDGNVSVIDSTWHHIACVRDSSTNMNKIYVDGVLSGQKTVAYNAGFDEGTTAVNIGWLNWTNHGQKFYYDGLLDEIAVFGTALNDANISQHYQNGLAGKGFEENSYTVSIAKTTDGAEPGTDASFTVTVTPANATGAVITGNIAYTGIATEGTDYATGAATFSIADGASTAVITLDTTDDTLVEGTETITATISNPSTGTLGTDNATADLTDNDTAGITVSAISGDTTEAGGTATFTVALNSEPTADVSIALSSSDTTEGTVAPASVTFTALNWNSPQTVTVTGADDTVADGNVPYTIVTAAATSTDTNYDGVDAADVAVTNIDNETAGITVSAISGDTTEAGGTATFTVALNSEPTADVNIALSSSDTTEGTVAPASVTFTALNWNSPQTVTVTGVDDAVADGDAPYTIVTAVATSTDTNYDGVDAADVAVTNIDNETAGITVSAISGDTTEAGGTATFTVALNSEPIADVSIVLSSSDATEGTVAPASLTFTAANWNTEQTVTVTGVDDAVVDGTVAYSIVTAAATSADPDYNGADAADQTVNNTDNDSYKISIFKTEDGAEPDKDASFTITVTPANATGAPITGTIAYTGTATNGTDYATGASNFSIANGASATVIMLDTTDDVVVEGTETIIATIAAPSIGSLGTDNATANLADNETATITIDDISGVEDGGALTFTATLNMAVAGGVTVEVNTADGTAIAGDDYTAVVNQTLTFLGTAGETQTFEVLPTADSTLEADEIFTMSMANVSNVNVDILDTAEGTLINDEIDTDGDGIPDVTDPDDDNDNVLDADDAFPHDADESVDTDGDGIGNNTDSDDDNDNVLDADDAFPLVASETTDTDGDGIGNNADSDDDNDNVIDTDDAFPLDATESVDTDGDGIGNNADSDDDNDNVIDTDDAFPLDADESVDTDGDGVGNNADTDDDNNGISDADEKDWVTYENSVATTENGSSIDVSTIRDVNIIPGNDQLKFTHEVSPGCIAYATVFDTEMIETGFEGCGGGNTLGEGRFPVGTQVVIKEDGSFTVIESTVTLNKGDSFVIGGE